MAKTTPSSFSPETTTARYKNLLSRFGKSAASRFARRRTVAAGGRVFSARVPSDIQQQPFTATFSGGKFAQALQSFAVKTDADIERILDDVGKRAYASIVFRTAVLTGEAAASWQYQRAPKRVRIFSDWPGIRRLEHGWSKQPGKGSMVRITYKLLPGFIQTAANRLGVARKS